MYIWAISGIDLAVWIQAGCAVMIFGISVWGLIVARDSLLHMKEDSRATYELFAIQNRPYLGLLPDWQILEIPSAMLKLTQYSSKEKYYEISFTIKNYGKLPAWIQTISAVVERKVVSTIEEPPIKAELSPSGQWEMVFPETEKIIKTRPVTMGEIQTLLSINLLRVKFKIYYRGLEEHNYWYEAMHEYHNPFQETGGHILVVREIGDIVKHNITF